MHIFIIALLLFTQMIFSMQAPNGLLDREEASEFFAIELSRTEVELKKITSPNSPLPKRGFIQNAEQTTKYLNDKMQLLTSLQQIYLVDTKASLYANAKKDIFSKDTGIVIDSVIKIGKSIDSVTYPNQYVFDARPYIKKLLTFFVLQLKTEPSSLVDIPNLAFINYFGSRWQEFNSACVDIAKVIPEFPIPRIAVPLLYLSSKASFYKLNGKELSNDVHAMINYIINSYKFMKDCKNYSLPIDEIIKVLISLSEHSFLQQKNQPSLTLVSNADCITWFGSLQKWKDFKSICEKLNKEIGKFPIPMIDPSLLNVTPQVSFYNEHNAFSPAVHTFIENILHIDKILKAVSYDPDFLEQVKVLVEHPFLDVKNDNCLVIIPDADFLCLFNDKWESFQKAYAAIRSRIPAFPEFVHIPGEIFANIRLNIESKTDSAWQYNDAYLMDMIAISFPENNPLFAQSRSTLLNKIKIRRIEDAVIKKPIQKDSVQPVKVMPIISRFGGWKKVTGILLLACFMIYFSKQYAEQTIE